MKGVILMNDNITEDNKLLLALSYVICPWIGIYIMLTDKKNDPTCKFHGLQSIFMGIIIYVLSVVFGLGILVWFYGCYYAYMLYTSKEEMNIPMLTDFTKGQMK